MNLTNNIGIPALEELMGLHMDENIEITGGTSIYTRLTLAGQPQSGAVINTGRNFDRDFFTGHHLAHAAAFRAGMSNDLAITAACRTGGADRKESLTAGNLTGAAAMPAGFRFGAFFATIAATVGTNFALFDFNFGFGTKNRFHKIQTQIISQIGSGHGPTP